MSKPCSNDKCSVSTGIHEGLTFGSGRLDEHGYWEEPCAPCARAHEAAFPKDGKCWPFEGQDIEQLKTAVRETLDAEDTDEVHFKRW